MWKGGQPDSVSEIEFRAPYVVAERWVVARMLRFMHAKNVRSDTLLIRVVYCALWGNLRGSGCPLPPSPPRLGLKMHQEFVVVFLATQVLGFRSICLS